MTLIFYILSFPHLLLISTKINHKKHVKILTPNKQRKGEISIQICIDQIARLGIYAATFVFFVLFSLFLFFCQFGSHFKFLFTLFITTFLCNDPFPLPLMLLLCRYSCFSTNPLSLPVVLPLFLFLKDPMTLFSTINQGKVVQSLKNIPFKESSMSTTISATILTRTSQSNFDKKSLLY